MEEDENEEEEDDYDDEDSNGEEDDHELNLEKLQGYIEAQEEEKQSKLEEEQMKLRSFN